MGFWKSVFGGNFSEGAVVKESAHVQDNIARALGVKGEDIEFDMMDAKYLTLTTDNMTSLVNKAIRLDTVNYHSNSDEFPDCDDYALMARGQVLRASIADRLKYAPCFFIVTGVMTSGTRHAWNITLDASNNVRFYEPQNNTWDSVYTKIDYIEEVFG